MRFLALGLIGMFAFGQQLPARRWTELEAHLRSHPETLYVLNFWATWCRPCVQELPHFEEVYHRLRDSLPLHVWLISLDFPPKGAQAAERLLRSKGITLPAFWLAEKDPNAWIPRLSSSWDGGIPYTQVGLSGPSQLGAFPSPEALEAFIRSASRR
uniref:Redoxin domain-containing protein n=1 Tax=uncultured Bacteroidota bacterium TaxID=152509 RepID=H5SMB1_9BACT|nr:redoxin domain-containing protein [uncultured Bacteroidetes bacterium]